MRSSDAFVDQQKLPTTAYTAQPGSLILTRLPEYLETVSLGTHVVEVTFSDGVTATAVFVAEDKAAGSANQGTGPRGVLINGVRAGNSPLEDVAEQVEAAEPEQPKQEFPLQPVLLTGGVVAAFAVGAGTRTVLFSREYEKGQEQTEEGTSDNGN